MASSTLLTIHEGKILGKELTSASFEGEKYLAFQGIPYAQPPVGSLRFRDPKPVEAWEGVKDATKEAPSCPQKHVLLREAIGEEDNCLALNVYTPSVEGEALPVMVWIHGGGFTFGSGNTDFHDPEYWMRQRVVLVTCNYRVGALGFLSLGTAEVPGNAGLKDQVMVLRWVKRNIAHFRGNPDNVTLFGESAGAASVHYHMLSPMSRGLFHRAIMMSGCSLNTWAFSKNEIQRSFRLAEQLGCTKNKPREVLDFMQQVPVFDIVKKQNKVVTVQDKRDMLIFPFVPCKEPAGGDGERFLTEHPRTLLQQGHIAPVPVIIGVNDKEGMLVLNDVPHSDEYLKVVNGNFSQFVPKNLGLPLNAAEKIKEFYFGDKPVSWDNIDSYIDYFGDLLFYLGIDETIRHHLSAAVAPVFCYNLSFDGQLGLLSYFVKLLYPNVQLQGVCHADDLGYIFKFNIPGPPQLVDLPSKAPEHLMVSWMTGLFKQFAITGSPSLAGTGVKWEPAERQDGAWRGFLELNNPLEMKNSRSLQDRMQFWDSLLTERPLQQKL